MQLQISSRRKTGAGNPESLRLEFREKISVNNFGQNNTENNTSGPLYGGEGQIFLYYENY